MKQIRQRKIECILFLGLVITIIAVAWGIVAHNVKVEKVRKDQDAQIEQLIAQRHKLEDAVKHLKEEQAESSAQLEERQREVEQLKSESSRGGSRGGQKVSMVVEASAYNPTDLSCSSGTGLAADGKPAVPYRTVAVDPNVIPYGSIIHVPGWGTGVAHDTGSAIIGNKIDIAVASNSEAFSWGRRDVEITVEYPR